MVDITAKNHTKRVAKAGAIVSVSNYKTIQAILEGTVAKGDVFEMSKTAGLFAAKRTHDIIPDCHPVPIEYTKITQSIQGLEICIQVEVATIYKTGVEVEAMHAASVVALTIYDMLKPIDKQIEIKRIFLIEKKGGKTDAAVDKKAITSIVYVSNAFFQGKKENKLTEILHKKLSEYGVKIKEEITIPEDGSLLQQNIVKLQQQGASLILVVGSTGLGIQDITPQTIHSLLDVPIPGVAEQMRHYGQMRSPKAMFSRMVTGYMGDVLIVTLPGSSQGLIESIDAVFPTILEAIRT